MSAVSARAVAIDPRRALSVSNAGPDAAQIERGLLARELHDGILQTLTGATLQLVALENMVNSDPDGVRNRLRDLGQLIGEHQRELRLWIEQLRYLKREAHVDATQLHATFEKFCKRLEWQWALQIELSIALGVSLPCETADEIYRLAQEAINNVGRHARAQQVRVTLTGAVKQVVLVVEDDGLGFPFHGRYDFDRLHRMGLGPVSLLERLQASNGDLILETSASGSLLEMRIPVKGPGKLRFSECGRPALHP